MTAHRHRTTVVVGAIILTVAGGALVAALSAPSARHAARPLPDYGRLPDFSLMDHQRQPITREKLAGSVWIADFIFTRCAGQCPIMSTHMAYLQRAFDGVPGIRFISFSVDPAYDTPEVLAVYAAKYGAQDHRWRFITGESEAIITLSREGFHLGVGEDGSPEEPITHSVRLVLVDQQGSIRGYYDATDAQAMQHLQDDARSLLVARR
jgi:protein SCO1/2